MVAAVSFARSIGLETTASIGSPASRIASASAWRRPRDERAVSSRHPWRVDARFPSLSPWRTIPTRTAGIVVGAAAMMKAMTDTGAMQRAIGDPALARLFTRRFVDTAERFDRLPDAPGGRDLHPAGGRPWRARRR